MATIRGMIPAFELFQPTSVEGALALLDRYRGARVLAGGLDTLDALYDRVYRPSVVVDLSGVAALPAFAMSRWLEPVTTTLT
jgi:xanthine dehydrogenase YagS FAD-binding subunit